MILVPAAFVLGAIGGLALGGSFRRLSQARFRWWALAIVGFGLQLLPVPAAFDGNRHAISLGLLFASYAALLVFVAANIRQRGFPVVAIGFALNALVIAANAGMPVSAQALRHAAGPDFVRDARHLQADGGAKHHLERPGDMLVPLSDVIGIGRPIDAIFSIGDFFWLAGTAWVVAGVMVGPRYRGKHLAGREVTAGADGAADDADDAVDGAVTPKWDGSPEPVPPVVVAVPEPLAVPGPAPPAEAWLAEVPLVSVEPATAYPEGAG